MSTFAISSMTVEIQRALDSIAGLTGSKITVKTVTVIECPDENTVRALRQLLGWRVMGAGAPTVKSNDVITPADPAPVVPAMVATPKSNLDVRNCEQCGAEYMPRRIDQKFCFDPACKKERQKMWNAKHKEAEETKITTPSPLAPQ